MADFILEHLTHITEPKRIPKNKIQVGDVIQFVYNNERKTVLVLNPIWERKLHALSLNAMPRKYLTKLMQEAKTVNPKQFYQTRLIKNPQAEYHAYRTYFLDKIGVLYKVDYELAN